MATANTKRTHSEDPNDLYNTEPLATLAAIKQGILPLDKHYWDPCDGLGGISDVLEGEGATVTRTDLIAYPGRETVCKPADFLKTQKAPKGVQRIIMNPPFKLNAEFITHAMSFGLPVYVFNRVNLLETETRANNVITGEWPLRKFYLFPYRVGCTRGTGRTPVAKAVPYCWFVFWPGHEGETALDYIIERPSADKYHVEPEIDLGLDDDLGL